MSNLFEEQAKHDADCVALGARAAEERHAERVRNLLSAYDRAMLDISARIPTPLHAAIEAFRDFKGPK